MNNGENVFEVHETSPHNNNKAPDGAFVLCILSVKFY